MFKGSLLKMKWVAQLVSEASQDTIQFCARSQGANVVVRKNSWLKHWKEDSLSNPVYPVYQQKKIKNLRMLALWQYSIGKKAGEN